MLINADVFLETVASYRLLWLTGRFSGGKTSLSYKIAEHFMKQGYRLITNNYSVWADDMQNIELDQDNFLKTVIILDEGGKEFKSSRQIENICSYGAKMDMIFLIPSYFPPTRAAQVITCQPLYHLKSIGLPLVIYRWRVKHGGFEDKGTFLWLYPQEIYGIYSRQDPGGKTDDIVEFLVEKASEYERRFNRERKPNSIPVMASETDQFNEAVGDLAEQVDRIVSISSRKTSNRRF